MNRCHVVNQLDNPRIGNNNTHDLIFDSKYTNIHKGNNIIL